jgi:uncharacterized protein with HEPN domain
VRSSNPTLYLTHILESIEFARSYVSGVDVELVWTVVHRDFEGLATEVRALLETGPADGGTL